MKKSRRKARTGNPAKKRRGEGAEDGGQRGGWPRWAGREMNALLSLPPLLQFVVYLLFLVLVAAALGVWRWLTG